MYQLIKKGIIYSDIFGYPVHLNFDKKGTYYKNCFGGLISLIFFGLIIFLSIEGILKIKFNK
jgi:hypothetical protein